MANVNGVDVAVGLEVVEGQLVADGGIGFRGKAPGVLVVRRSIGIGVFLLHNKAHRFPGLAA